MDEFTDLDHENLEFLLAASPETLADWWEQSTEDDHEYAMELLKAYRREVKFSNVVNNRTLH